MTNDSQIPVNRPYLDQEEERLLRECIKSGWISSEGSFVKEFEQRFAAYCGRQHGIAVCNGTAALDIAVRALQLKSGDEVIMPSFTIISCAQAVINSGATPVLVDSELDTWNMDTSKIEAKITAKTKAIMVVHIYGLPVDMDKVIEIANKHKLLIIEDAAEAHGLEYMGKKCGSFGHLSVFSFYSNKLITTGEGGMVICDEDYLARRCKSLRNLCFDDKQRFIHEELGFNYRMTNMQAAIGIAQLNRIEWAIRRKREIGALYRSLLCKEKKLQLPVGKTAYASNIYWVFGVIIRKNRLSAKVIMEKLAKHQIGTRPFFYPMHLQPVFNKLGMFKDEYCPIAEYLYQQGFYLPSGLGHTNEEIIHSANVLLGVLNEE